jgi:hypothetical protein
MAEETINYVVHVNLPQEEFTELAVDLFRKWAEFALGISDLGGGRKIVPHTLTYYSGLQYKQVSPSLIVLSNLSKTANVIEKGHPAIDLKIKMLAERGLESRVIHLPEAYSGAVMGGVSQIESWQNRSQLRSPFSSSSIQFKSTSNGLVPEIGPTNGIWKHYSNNSGFYTISQHSQGWIIPALPAYSPAKLLAAMAGQSGQMVLK